MNFKQSQVRIKIILIMALALVLALSVVTYKNLAGIVKQASQAVKPDLMLVDIKSMTNEIAKDELLVKSYTISHDTSIITQYTRNFQSIDRRLELLRSQSQSEKMRLLLDSISSIMDQKFALITSLFEIQNSKGVERIFDKINKELEQGPNKETISEKQPFLKRIFKKRTKTEAAQVDLERVKDEVRDIRHEEMANEYAVNTAELNLTAQIGELEENVNGVVTEMEEFKRAQIKDEIAKSEKRIERAKAVVLIFCFFTGLLILVSFYLIQNYLGKNKAYHRAMKRAKEDAEELAASKEKFLATMSHEIRTPLNAVVGFVEQLKQTRLSPEQSSQLSMIDKSSTHLLHVVNEVLDYSKLQAGKLRLIKTDFPVNDVVTEVIDMLQVKATEKGLNMNCYLHESIPARIVGDPYRLKQILINLLGNSIKFTSEGRIHIHVKPKLLNHVKCTLEFVVEDTGIGISQDHLDRIFEEFEQVKSNGNEHYNGTGLGLAISKQLVDLHDGHIEIESTPGKGTTVRVTIPYIIYTADTSPKESAENNLPLHFSLTDKNILVVDDEEYNRKLIETILQKHQPAITMVSDGRQAVNEMKRENYDLILMDVRMPVMNGLDATEQIRALGDLTKAEVPIIIVSAALNDDDRARADEVRVNGVLRKPFREAELMRVISNVLGTESFQETPFQNEGVRAQEESRLMFNPEGLRQMAEVNPDVVSEMLHLFINTSSVCMTQIRENLTDYDPIALSNAAHKMLSPCRHLDIKTMIDILEEIEQVNTNDLSRDALWQLVEELEQRLAEVVAQIEKYLQPPINE